MTGIADIEQKTIISLTKYFADKWIIFDVGSNKGEWSDILLSERTPTDKYSQWEFHLFEANKLLFDYTRVKYDYTVNMNFINRAVCDKPNKEIDFYFFENFNNGLSSIYFDDFWDDQKLPYQKGKVKTISLDSYAEKIQQIDFVKIDVEGADVDVLRGASGLLNSKRVKFLQVEYGGHYKKRDYKFKRDVIDFVGQFGYSVWSFDGVEFHKITEFIEDYHAENYIITYLEIGRYHYTQLWNSEFQKNTRDLGKFRFVLEIGAFEGLTSNYICDNLLTSDGRMICVDPLLDKYMDYYDQATNQMFVGQFERFTRNTAGKPIELIRMRSDEAWPRLMDFLFDFIYIDGDHTAEGVYQDGMHCFDLLRKGGYILFDDYKWAKETADGINRFLGRKMGQYDTIIADYQILIRKK